MYTSRMIYKFIVLMFWIGSDVLISYRGLFTIHWY